MTILKIFKRGIFILILSFIISACETAKDPLVGERVSVFEKNIDKKENSADEKILLNRPYINESWTASS